MPKASRTAIVTRKLCEQKRWYQTEQRLTADQTVRGISPIGTIISELPKLRGQWLHQVAEAMFYGREWHTQLEESVKVIEDDDLRVMQHALVRRAMIGWQIVRGSWYAQHFIPISAEKEWEWDMGKGVTLPLRMDQIIRKKDDNALGILDFKTKSTVDANWVEKMKNDDQTMLYVQALKEKSNEWVMGIVYEGILIGKLKDGMQQTPFVMGYQSKSTGKVSPKYSAGTDKVSLVLWSDDDWLKWIRGHGMLNDLYTTTGFCNPSAQELVRTKISTREAELRWEDTVETIDHAEKEFGSDSPEVEELKAVLMEKQPEACLKFGWDYACPYYKVCRFGATMEGFLPRVDHHGNEGNE